MRGARRLAGTVIQERKATFVPSPGSRECRLPAQMPTGGLFLAGAWIDTGWLATLEGAVRSAESAVATLASDSERTF